MASDAGGRAVGPVRKRFNPLPLFPCPSLRPRSSLPSQSSISQVNDACASTSVCTAATGACPDGCSGEAGACTGRAKGTSISGAAVAALDDGDNTATLTAADPTIVANQVLELVDAAPEATCTDAGAVCASATGACPAGCTGTAGACTGTATCALGAGGLAADCPTGCTFAAAKICAATPKGEALVVDSVAGMTQRF